jgi:hypothetical protein
MRGAAVVIVVGVVAACNQHYGAYVAVEAGHAGPFDHLEMFFTTGDADTTGKLAPRNTSGAGPFVDPDAVSTEVFVRAFAATDSFAPAATATTATFELPAGTEVGATVIAIATNNGAVVGYGRLDGMKVPARDYVKYSLALAPQPAATTTPAGQWPLGAEIWQPNPAIASGPGLTCARVTDAMTTTFVVTEGDGDCDGYTEPDHDCAPSFYCDPAVRPNLGLIDPCVSACGASVQGSTNCAVGACANGSDPTAALVCHPAPSAGANLIPCIPCTSSCDYRPIVPFLDCVANHDASTAVTCSFAVDQTTGKLCNTPSLAKALLSINATAPCAAALLAPTDDPDFTFAASVPSTSACSVEIDVTPKKTSSALAASTMLLVELPSAVTGVFAATTSVRVQPMPVAAVQGVCSTTENVCAISMPAPTLTQCP